MNTEQLKLENEKLTARLEKAKEVFRQQAADAKAREEAYLKLRNEYNNVVKERDIHIEANVKCNKQLAEAGYDREAYVGQIDALNDKVKELEALATARLTDINKNKEEIKKLNNIIVELNNQYASLEIKETEEYNALVLRYDNLTAEYNLLNEQFVDLENEYNNAEELRKSYTDATNKLNEEVSRLQDIIVSKDAAYKNLESTYNDFAVEHTRDVNALKYTIDQLKKDIEDKDAKLVDACAKVGTLTHQLETETGKVEEVKTKTEEAVTSIKKKLQALNDGLGDEFNIFG